jgi:hypothetical protein
MATVRVYGETGSLQQAVGAAMQKLSVSTAVLRLEPVFSDSSALRGLYSLRWHSRTYSRHQSSGVGF